MRRWLSVSVIVAILAVFLLGTVQTVNASHGMWGGQAECGERVFKADLVKGRTDSLVFHARHTAGCFTYDYTNYVPAGNGESQGNSWQQAECRRYAEHDVAYNYFDQWAHVKVDPADIKYTCEPYHGPD